MIWYEYDMMNSVYYYESVNEMKEYRNILYDGKGLKKWIFCIRWRESEESKGSEGEYMLFYWVAFFS